MVCPDCNAKMLPVWIVKIGYCQLWWCLKCEKEFKG